MTSCECYELISAYAVARLPALSMLEDVQLDVNCELNSPMKRNEHCNKVIVPNPKYFLYLTYT